MLFHMKLLFLLNKKLDNTGEYWKLPKKIMATLRKYDLSNEYGLVHCWKENIKIRNEKNWVEERSSKSTLKQCKLAKNDAVVERNLRSVQSQEFVRLLFRLRIIIIINNSIITVVVIVSLLIIIYKWIIMIIINNNNNTITSEYLQKLSGIELWLKVYFVLLYRCFD